jgi:predicted  nucleic acid-binding Zn-ribbon protein
VKLQDLRRKADKLRSDAAKAEGRLEDLRDQLVEKFGCKTIKAAKEKLKKLEGRTSKARKDYERKLKAFEKKFADDV